MLLFGDNQIGPIYLGDSEITSIYQGDELIYTASAPIINYVTFTAQQANSTIGLQQLSSNQKLWYSTDVGETWNDFTTGITITLANSGDTCYVAGMLSGDNSDEDYTQFNLPNMVSVSGNINSLWNYMDLNQDLYQYCGYYLFSGCAGLVNASGLTLGTSATTLADYCYESMFFGCTSLTSAPELPATALADWCYMDMFESCSSLTTAPVLPATTLAEGCYTGMFYNCTSLTAAPVLPATTLASLCYQGMFESCSSLTTAPVLPATTLADGCYTDMFNSCTSLTTAPELPATTLVEDCYNSMFLDCSSLNYIKCLATNISARDCTYQWVDGVASSGTFVKDVNMTGWATGIDGIPTNWTVEDAQ